jgi:hypothetical protein
MFPAGLAKPSKGFHILIEAYPIQKKKCLRIGQGNDEINRGYEKTYRAQPDIYIGPFLSRKPKK